MKRLIKAVFVDDEEADAVDYAARLSDLDGVKCKPLKPPTAGEDVSSILKGRPDIVLIDYQLSRPQGKNQLPAFKKGSTLAAAVREASPTTPILLVSRQELEDQGKLEAVRDVSGAFDELILKKEIIDNPETILRLIAGLVEGFQLLVTPRRKSWQALTRILGAQPSEEDLLMAADPPAEIFLKKTWRVVEVAAWIRNTLITFPGVLYDSLHASAILGISKESFLSPNVQKFFADAKYKGPFPHNEGTWWKGRLLESAYDLLQKTEQGRESLTRFGEAWRRAKKKPALKPAICVSSGEAPADSACYLLKKPVMRRYSLPYRPDNRPRAMDEARVSFKAIRESNAFDERLCPPDARSFIPSIQKKG